MTARGPRHVIDKHRGAGRFPSSDSRETAASYGLHGLRRKAVMTTGLSWGREMGVDGATSIVLRVDRELASHQGGHNLLPHEVARTAGRCLQWGGCAVGARQARAREPKE